MTNITMGRVGACAAGFVVAMSWSPGAMAQEVGVEASSDEQWRLGFGARVGGYGFREATAEGETTWEDCRMNGVGVFTTLDVTPSFFGEVSLDLYHAHAEVVNDGMDRLSMHALGSLGVRMFPDFYVTPYVQLGGGVEWTTVDMVDDELSTRGWYPVGFMGIGAEVNVTDHLKLGANIRAFIMKHPEHDHAEDPTSADSAHVHAHTHTSLGGGDSSSTGVPMSFEAAGQAQFFLRYAL